MQLCTFFSVCLLFNLSLGAMNDDDDDNSTPSDSNTAHRRHTTDTSANKKPTPEATSKNTLIACFNHAVNKNIHQEHLTIKKLPALNGRPYHGIISINFNHSMLDDPNTVGRLLRACPQLTTLRLSHNQLATLRENVIPQHNNLTFFDCDHNPITIINFTELYSKIPALQEFNASGCPLTHFIVRDIKNTGTAPRITLHDTTLFDEDKLKIMQTSHQPHELYQFCPSFKNSTEPRHGTVCGPAGMTLFIGSFLGEIASLGITIPLMVNRPIEQIDIGLIMALQGIFAVIVGPLVAYNCSICCIPRTARINTLYAVDFGPSFNPPAKSTMTPYIRFLANFPEFCCVKKSKYAALEQVDTE